MGLSFQELKPILWGTISNKDPQPVSRCRERVPQANQRCSVSVFAHCSIFFAPVLLGFMYAGLECHRAVMTWLLLKRGSQGGLDHDARGGRDCPGLCVCTRSRLPRSGSGPHSSSAACASRAQRSHQGERGEDAVQDARDARILDAKLQWWGGWGHRGRHCGSFWLQVR